MLNYAAGAYVSNGSDQWNEYTYFSDSMEEIKISNGVSDASHPTKQAVEQN